MYSIIYTYTYIPIYIYLYTHAYIKYIYKIKYYEYHNNTEINHNITFILTKQDSDMIHKLPYYKCNYKNLLPCSLCTF